jgi:hypothetical protein
VIEKTDDTNLETRMDEMTTTIVLPGYFIIIMLHFWEMDTNARLFGVARLLSEAFCGRKDFDDSFLFSSADSHHKSCI